VVLLEPDTWLRATGRFDSGWVEVKRLSGTSGWVRSESIKQVLGPEPLHQVSAMINLDMIGRLQPQKPVSVLGAQSGEGFVALLNELSAQTGVSVNTSDAGVLGGGSDHFHFLRSRVPVLFFFTGMHRQYNTPDDDLQTLNLDGEAALLSLVRATAVRLADADAPPRFSAPPAAASRDAGRRPQLGVLADTDFRGRGVRVAEVVDGSVARRAGLEVGDVLLALGDKQVGDLEELLAALEAGPQGKVSLRVLRGQTEKVFEVDFPQRRGGAGVRFGSMPDYAFAEKGVRFEDIQADTSASRAGVRAGDVLVRWGSAEVADIQQWMELLRSQTPGDEVEIVVRRGSETITLKVKLEAR
jgi:C-terminal processing protease CtpA/Prc